MWVCLIVAGALAAAALPGRLVSSVAVPNTDSARAQALLTRAFGERPEGSFAVVFRVHHSGSRPQQLALGRRVERAARVLPNATVEGVQGQGGIVWVRLATTLSVAQAKRATPGLRSALAQEPGPRALVTGPAAVQHDLDPILGKDLRRGEAVAIPLAVLGLTLVFGLSLALAVPFVFAACTILGTLLLVFAATQFWQLTPYTPNVVVLIGLGLALDYSLLVVSRFREEVEQAEPEEAVVRTMATAGRAIVFSGLAVALGLGLLLFVPVPFIRSIGVGALLIPLVSIAAALTVQPVLLASLGRRAANGLRVLGWSRKGGREPWAAFARLVMRRPMLTFLAAAAVLVAAALPARSIVLGPGSLASLPKQTEAARGLALVSRSFGPGALAPTEVVVDGGRAGAVARAPVARALDRLANRLFHDPEVHVVAGGPGAPYVDPSGRYARLIVLGRHEYGDPASRGLVRRLREQLIPAARFPVGARVFAGGAPPQGADFVERSYANFPWLVAAALLLIFLILVRAFRSLLLPLKAVLLNLISVAASYGLLVLVFRDGVGAGLLGVHRSDQIEAWIPIFLLAVLFGLSMDYEVFVVSRMREAWDAGRSNTAAVAFGLERTGRLIGVAALVMIASFAGFIAGSVPGLQQFGLGLALAILIDVTIVRLVLVPSLMAVLGRWNWWLPTVRRPSTASARSSEPEWA